MKNPDVITLTVLSIFFGFILALALQSWGVELLLPKPWPPMPEWRLALGVVGLFIQVVIIFNLALKLAKKN